MILNFLVLLWYLFRYGRHAILANEGQGRTWRAEETFYGLQEYRETQGKKEDTIDQSRKYLCPVPPVGVARIDMRLLCELYGAHMNMRLGQQWGTERGVP